MNWHGLKIYGLQFDIPIPGHHHFWGFHLRGILGRALFDTVCLYAGRRDDRACPSCPLNTRCAYPAVFKPVDDNRLPPYWLHVERASENTLRYTWYILEPVRQHLEAWLSGLHRHWRRTQQTDLTLWDRVSGECVLNQHGMTVNALKAIAPPELETTDYRLITLSPLISKHQGDPLYGSLRTRLQRLIQLYGDDNRLLIEPQPWHCERVATETVNIKLSHRVLKGHHYQLNLSQISVAARELLQWGQCLHAGGHTTVACGAYRLIPELNDTVLFT